MSLLSTGKTYFNAKNLQFTEIILLYILFFVLCALDVLCIGLLIVFAMKLKSPEKFSLLKLALYNEIQDLYTLYSIPAGEFVGALHASMLN